jgi:hypothetical protein
MSRDARSAFGMDLLVDYANHSMLQTTNTRTDNILAGAVKNVATNQAAL